MSARESSADLVTPNDVVVTEKNDIGPSKKNPKTKIKKKSSRWGSRKNVKEKDLYSVQLAFKHLSFSVPIPQKKSIKNLCAKKEVEYKTILQNITGSFEQGTLTAIMGSSGAGKTTLLNVLAGRSVGRVEGDLLYNGHPRKDAKNIMRKQAYVMQDDIMLGSQTGRELLQFAADLRMGEEFTQEQRLARVNEIIEELGLTDCQHVRVGTAGEMRGVSGGERKRIAIGMELITNPSLLFLDEPTSGLDSFTAERVIETLQHLAKAGRTVICTIHQPNSNIFHLFDKLILLAKGEVVYNGEANKALEYFDSLGYQCPPFTNPSDFFMKLIHIEQSAEGGDATVKKLIQDYKDSELCKSHLENPTPKLELDNDILPFYTRGSATQIKMLFRRNLRDIFREPLKIRATTVQAIAVSIVIGLIFLRLDNDQPSIQSRLGALFFLMVNSAMSSVSGVVNTFPKEKKVFVREHANRMYSPFAFFFSKTLSEMPFGMLISIIFATISYWMIGFQSDAERFFIFLTALTLMVQTGGSIGLLLGTVAKDASVATALVPIFVIPFLIFSGFIVNTKTVPKYFIWVEYISFVKYGFRIVAVNEFSGLKLDCPEDEKFNGLCRIPNGDAEIKLLGFEDANRGIDLIILLSLFIGIRSLAFLALWWRSKSEKANA